MQTQLIDPTELSAYPVLQRAMRLTAKHWPLAYSKLLSLDWQWTSGTAYGATDGRRLLLNPNGLAKLARQPKATGLTAFLLVHEALHAMLNHGFRLGKLADHDRANKAADYVINSMINNRNKEIGKEVFVLIEGILLDEMLSGNLSATELYRILSHQPQQPKPQPQPQDSDDSDDGDDGDQQDGDDAAGDDGDDEQDGDQQGGDDAAGDDGDDAAGDDGGDAAGDDGDSGDAAGDSGDAAGGDAAGDNDLSDFVGTGAPDLIEPQADPASGKTQEEIVDDIERSNDAILTRDAIDRRTGNGDGETGSRIAGQRKPNPSISWTDLLSEWLRARTNCAYTGPLNPPLFIVSGLVGAGRRPNGCGEIVLVLDSSGSVPDRIFTSFLQKAQEILDELRPEALHLLSVSHKVCDYVELRAGDSVPDRLAGGGLTLFQPAFDFLQERSIMPEVLLYLTDGESPDLDRLIEPDYPVLWLSTYTQPKHYLFGDVVMVDERDL